MTEAFSAAIATASRLPPEEQNVLASILLEEISSEERWGELFEGSQGLLEGLTGEAMRYPTPAGQGRWKSWNEVGHDREISTALRPGNTRQKKEDQTGISPVAAKPCPSIPAVQEGAHHAPDLFRSG